MVRLIIFALVWLFLCGLSAGQNPSLRSQKTDLELRGPSPHKTEDSVSTNSISSPILGYVFDPAHGGLRPIKGILGASTLGEVLPLRRKLSHAQVSAQQEYALVVTVDTQEAQLLPLNLRSEDYLLRPIAGTKSGISRIALSPTGSSAALFYSERRSVQVITGLPTAPLADEEIDISSVPGSLTAMAISDDTSAILLGVSDQTLGAVYSLRRGGEVQWITSVDDVSAISFMSRTHDALIADRQANEVLLISDVLGAIKKTVLVGQSEGLLGPIAVESSEDNQRVFIADSGSNSIYSLELASGTVTHFSSRRPLAGLFRLRGKSIFRVTELTGQPILLFDGGAELRAFFVPVEQAKFASGGESVLPVRGQSRPIRVPRRRN